MARMSPRARAAVMSLLFPGLGQLYLAKPGRAGIWFVGLVAIYLIAGQRDSDRWIAPILAAVLGSRPQSRRSLSAVVRVNGRDDNKPRPLRQSTR